MKSNYPEELEHYNNNYITSEKGTPALSERDLDKILEFVKEKVRKECEQNESC